MHCGRIDAKQVDDHWEIFTHGGRKPTGINAVEWRLKWSNLAPAKLLASMDEMAPKQVTIWRSRYAVSDAVAVPVIASGE